MRTVCVQRVSKALFNRTFLWKHAVHSLYQLATFFTIRPQFFFVFIFYGWTVRRLCVTGTILGQQKHNEFRACTLLVPSVSLALIFWRLHSHVEKRSHF